jgi:hypothetical protein
MLKRILIGAGAGALATVPQSLVVWGLKAAGLYGRTPPPAAVAEGVSAAAVDLQALPEEQRRAITLAAHFAFGAAGGAAFGLTTVVVRPTPVAGLLAGLAIWKASYDGWIPAMRIMPPPAKDESGRVLTMVLAHVAYGLTLGALVDWWTRHAWS